MRRCAVSRPRSRARSCSTACTRSCPTSRRSRPNPGRSKKTARCASSRRSMWSAKASARSCSARAARPSRRSAPTHARRSQKDGAVRIEQTIYVERESQRKIVLGKGGATIKAIGAEARKEIAEMTEQKVHLFLFVKVREGWGDDVRTDQTIYVERESQRKIVLGKGGATIKAIGAEARKEIAEMAEQKVHLFLFVKVREGWGDDPERYRAMGIEFPKE